MMSQHARTAFLVGVVAAGVVAASMTSCSGDSATKKRVSTGGAGGEAGEGGGESAFGGETSAGGPGLGGSTGDAAGMGGAATVAGSAGASGDTAASGASADGGAAGTDCGSTAVGSRILVEFDTADAERVTNLQWTDSAATLTPNLAAAGGTLQCSDPLEFFGQAYGAEGMLPAPVIAGDLATLVRCGFDATITSAPTDCGGTAQFPVTTEYHSYAGARANELRVTRTFGFGATAAVFPQTILRPYVPRLPVAKFSAIIYPNQAGTAVTVGSPGGCATDCLVPTGTTWSGRWYADVDPTSGQAMIVLRDPALTSAVSLAINNDGLSASNLSSFLLLAPGGGWLEPVTEIEYLCFADLTSWPQAARTAATLPAGCGP